MRVDEKAVFFAVSGRSGPDLGIFHCPEGRIASACRQGRHEDSSPKMLVERSDQRNVFDLVNGKYSFIMSFERHDEFWVKSYFGKVFHVFSPFEGLLFASLLSVFTWRSVRWLKAVGEREHVPG